MKKYDLVLAVAISAWAGLPVFGQATPDRLTVPFSDASRPGTVRAGLNQGNITVKAYNGKEVIVEARTRPDDAQERKRIRGKPGREPEAVDTSGLRRIPITSTGLEVEEDNNVVSINTTSHARPVDLNIQVPARTSLKLRALNDDITVEGVQGEVEVNSNNGNVTLTNVAGSAVAHALNGRIQARFVSVEAKAMSFSSMNGNIDVTFPADLKATVKMKCDNGDVFSDFDVMVKPSQQTVVESGREGKGKYRVRIDKTVYGTINGGGPEIQFSNFNGNIYIRKAGK